MKLRETGQAQQHCREEEREQHQQGQDLHHEQQRHPVRPEKRGSQAGGQDRQRHHAQVDQGRQQRHGPDRREFCQQQPQPRHRGGHEHLERAALALSRRQIDRRVDAAGNRHQHEDERNQGGRHPLALVRRRPNLFRRPKGGNLIRRGAQRYDLRFQVVDLRQGEETAQVAISRRTLRRPVQDRHMPDVGGRGKRQSLRPVRR